MKTLLIRFFLTFMAVIPLFSYLFYVVNSLFQKCVSQKHIILFLCATASLYTLMAVNDVLMFFKGYFIFATIIFFPVIFYKGKNITKRMECGFLLAVFFMVIDLLNIFLFFALTDSDNTINFSAKKQIYYIGIDVILFFLLSKPIKAIIQYLINKSALFFVQIFLLTSLFFFQIGTMNYILAVDDFSYVFGSTEIIEFSKYLLGLISLDVITIYALNRLDKSYKIESEIRLNRQKKEMQQSYYTLVEKHYRQSRELVHDLKNHVLTLEHLYEIGEKEQASLYIDETIKNMEAVAIKEMEEFKGEVIKK